ncbi:hypothetical protein O181_118185 [Austropuccinia psidii MF-1]|uniref:Uncharacterized protein n=1 Tax=Austropuccinia psidii MF-1 TaxID=1389203 RepID=A0A9Q3KFW0_9BASI|nr:hypothetical protein [Austropuccinia psidii MF-1]
MANSTETKHKGPLPILMENKFPEWRRQTIRLLWKKKLYVHCIEETHPSAVDNKIIDAKIETCNIITNSLDCSMFAKIVVGDEEMENAYLLWSKLIALPHPLSIAKQGSGADSQKLLTMGIYNHSSLN